MHTDTKKATIMYTVEIYSMHHEKIVIQLKTFMLLSEQHILLHIKKGV